MDLISVIVPVYNVEPYLDRCIDSIVNQTYENLEIILVDDGSTDNCPKMCDQWAAKDSRIKVIHQKNAGSGAARNVALDVAQGEFVSMIDSDDYIEPHMYEHLHSLMTDGVDIAECGLIETEQDNEPLDDGSNFESNVYTAEEAMKLHIADALFRQTPPNKLYRRSTIANIQFPVGNRIDDEFWTYRVIANAEKLVHSSCNMYAYRQQDNSVMHIAYSIKRLQAIEAKCLRLEYVEEFFPELKSEACVNLWISCLFQGQMSLKYLDREKQKEAFSYLEEVLRKRRLSKQEFNLLTSKYKLWAYMSKLSFKLTCYIRNFLKIGC